MYVEQNVLVLVCTFLLLMFISAIMSPSFHSLVLCVCVCVSDARTCSMANCQYGCEVMKGEVRCQCPSPGLQLAPDGRTCVGTAARCEPNKLCYFTLNSKALPYEEAQHREALPLPPSPSGSWLLFNSDL